MTAVLALTTGTSGIGRTLVQVGYNSTIPKLSA
jgi:hypothetical protein